MTVGDEAGSMGAWYLSLSGSLLLIFIGLYTHWSILLIGALLPFVPMATYLLQRNRSATQEAGNPDAEGQEEPQE
jgi:hypothetical protein